MKLDFNDINTETVYDSFQVDGREDKALNDVYFDLYKLIGKEATLILFKHFHGDKIDFPMRLYRLDFIADLAQNEPNRQERAKIARAGGYTIKFIEDTIRKRRKGNKEE